MSDRNIIYVNVSCDLVYSPEENGWYVDNVDLDQTTELHHDRADALAEAENKRWI